MPCMRWSVRAQKVRDSLSLRASNTLFLRGCAAALNGESEGYPVRLAKKTISVVPRTKLEHASLGVCVLPSEPVSEARGDCS